MTAPPETSGIDLSLPTVLMCAALVGVGIAACRIVVRRAAQPRLLADRDVLGALAAGAVIACAAAATFHGLHALSRAAGLPQWVAIFMPLLLDGAALLTARTFINTAYSRRTRRFALAIAVLLGVGSLLGNVGAVLTPGNAPPPAGIGVQVALAVVPPLALILVGTLRHLENADRKALAHAKVERQNAVELAAETVALRQQVERDAQQADESRRHADEQRLAAEQAVADAKADEAGAAEHAIYADLLAAQARHDHAVEADALHQAETAKTQRVEAETKPAAATTRAAAPRKRGRTGGRQQRSLARDVADAQSILAVEDLGRNQLAERLGCTPDRARKVLEAIRAEQQNADADPLEQAWSAPAAEPVRHVNGASVAGGGA